MSEIIEEKKNKLRQMIVLEDSYLQERTNIFLVASGLLVTAAGVSNDSSFQLVIALLAIVVCVFWFLCAYQSYKIVVYLHAQYAERYHDDEFASAIQGMLFRNRFLRPTELLSLVLPMVFLFTWLILISTRLIL